MRFLRLIYAEASTLTLRRLLGMAVLAGLSNAAVLALINAAASMPPETEQKTRLALMFVAVIVVYSISQHYIMVTASREIEQVIHRVRLRLVTALLACELRDLERIGRSRIFAGISQEIQVLSQSATTLVTSCQLAVLVFFATFYLIALSFTAFFLSVAFMGVAILLYFRKTAVVNRVLYDATQKELELHGVVTGVLDGFKEIKVNRARSRAIEQDIVHASMQASDFRVRAQNQLARNLVFVQNTFYLLLATMVFIVPVLSHTTSDIIVKTTTAVLFLVGPISGLVASVPIFATANTAASGILALETELLGAQGSVSAAGRTAPDLATFKTIRFDHVVFRHSDPSGEHPFVLGPVDLTLKAGETVFISGGNGSGKSTFLRLLTALYRPDEGTISLDGRPLDADTLESYRSLFSTVFSDYHLFRELYGVAPEAKDEIDELLETFEISSKTKLANGHFDTVDLSAGQRKRLALIVAVLERRPICVLDEWAADQDPVFRRKFYHEIIRALKERGITVVAVTHDDRYYDLADRLIRFEEGKLAVNEPERANA